MRHWYTENDTFWGHKHGADVADLTEEIPAMGPVKDKSRPALEEWRKLQNAYYRYYNDGDSYKKQLHHMFKRHGVQMPWDANDKYMMEMRLEELADKVFKCAMDERATQESEA